MAAVDDVDELIEQYHLATGKFHPRTGAGCSDRGAGRVVTQRRRQAGTRGTGVTTISFLNLINYRLFFFFDKPVCILIVCK